MNIKNLSDNELTSRIDLLRSKEREITLKFLTYLGEFDKRRLYLELGFSSLFDYCTRKLGYSDGSAFRRVESARCLKENPELSNDILSGKVSLSVIATAARAIKDKKISVFDIIGKSAREVTSLIAENRPVGKPKEKITEIKVIKERKREALPLQDLFSLDQFQNVSLLQESPISTSKSEPKPEPDTRYEIKFSLSKDIYNELQTLRSKLSNKLGSNISIEGIFTELIKNYSKKGKAKKIRNANKNSRYVPISIKREVADRDGGKCSYVSKDGIRCTQDHYLHYDHVKPFALGGKTTSDNLRFLCRAHNHMFARMTFGEVGFARK